MDEPYSPVITLAEQVAAAERELKLRERVYPRRVDAGQMSKRLAAHEIAAMRAIITTLKDLAAGERLL